MSQSQPSNTTSSRRHAGGCAQPVLLRGRIDHIDGSTGELIHRYATTHEPGGVLPVACKTRRASRCLPCAETYRADTYQLIRAGITGGKGIPAAVVTHPAVFLTLTAPSLGTVHARRERNGRVLPCRPRRKHNTCPHGQTITCTKRHDRHDAQLGQPLCTIALDRALARQVGLTVKDLRAHARISYAKVAEYQRRGVVHFHAIIRIDGPDGSITPPPAWATTTQLGTAITRALRATRMTTPTAPTLPARTLTWGTEHDIRPITTSGDLTDTKVAAYVAKYATKAAECTGTLDRRITPADRLVSLPVSSHARRLIAECLRLSQLPELADLRLTAWAHMLGFRGHFSTKSRRYSITLGSLRAARANHQCQHAIATGRMPDLANIPDTVLVLSAWSFHGRGHAFAQPRGGEHVWT